MKHYIVKYIHYYYKLFSQQCSNREKKMKNIVKKIFYEKDTKFYIIPNMITNDIFDFKKHILIIKSEYQQQYQKDCFFWDFDEETKSIIINENAFAIENDIFSQLILLVHWLFNKNYYVKGSYHSRIDDIIEYVSMDGINKFICHHILVDFEITEDTFEKESRLEDMGNKIIIDAKNKIKKHIDLLKIKSPLTTGDIFNNMQFNKNIIAKKLIIKNKTDGIPYVFVDCLSTNHKNEEKNLIIKSLQERVTELENKQKTQINVNKFFLRVFTIIGFITAGSFIYLSMNYK